MILLFLTACSDANLAPGKASDDTAYAPDDTGPDDSATDSGDVTTNPATWALSATVDLVDSLPDATTALGSIRVVDADGVTVDCDVGLDLSGLAAADSPDPTIDDWWTTPLVAADEPCAPLPATLGFGIGILDPEVRARLGSVGMDEQADLLYGAYLQADDGDVYTVGYASAAHAGGPPIEPPPDDTYALVSLFLMPLP